MDIATILIIAYSIWAIYSGWKWVTGRWNWLEIKRPVNVIAKIVATVAVGYIIGAYYFLLLVCRFMKSIMNM